VTLKLPLLVEWSESPPYEAVTVRVPVFFGVKLIEHAAVDALVRASTHGFLENEPDPTTLKLTSPVGATCAPTDDVSLTATVHFVAWPAFTEAGLQLTSVLVDRFVTSYVVEPVIVWPEISPWTEKAWSPSDDVLIGMPTATVPVHVPNSSLAHSKAASTVWPLMYVEPVAGLVIARIGVYVTDGGSLAPPMMSAEPIQPIELTKLEPAPPPLPFTP
jgi:hypothetical protein